MTLVTATLGGASFALFWHSRPVVNASPVSRPSPTPPAAVSPTASMEIPSEIRPLNLLDTDEVEPGSEFDRLRRDFRHAVANRDPVFIMDLLPEESPLWDKIGEARIWEKLEKAIALGCIIEENPTTIQVDPFTSLWICPPVQSELLQAYPPSIHSPQPRLNWEKNQVVVVGAGVNVRSGPDIDSEVISVASNEVLTRNPSPSEEKELEETPDSLSSPLDGWTAIWLPSGEAGYIYNRYVYSPLDPQIHFGQVQGQWKLFYVPQPPNFEESGVRSRD
ncbi:hypothetical protein PJF56_05285 [Roseofilum sp. BLCC_M91]|uniref:SH3 domain-containing protein n=1 Tax=Roseofilum halophilum BLCC-M91 TaxID=3022259 RepID=A0ABT7BJ12_9CYAN|nr:hypothetical protein [Roseofilum halophilum]MDJ1178268.1 hypothetical protein [Roseofilum halophilum BLCC-M91]